MACLSSVNEMYLALTPDASDSRCLWLPMKFALPQERATNSAPGGACPNLAGMRLVVEFTLLDFVVAMLG